MAIRFGKRSQDCLEDLSPVANKIDQEGFYPSEIMRDLAAKGAFCGHLDKYGSRYELAVDAMTESVGIVARRFYVVVPDVCGLYMEQSGNSALVARLDDHVRGNTLGSTGLSNPMKALTGIEKMALKAAKVNEGYVVNGCLPWVSHIRVGGYYGVIAGVDTSKTMRSCFVNLVDRASLRECPHFPEWVRVLGQLSSVIISLVMMNYC